MGVLMSKGLSPFDFTTAINQTKKNIIVDDMTEKSYSSFMVNRSLSYFPDTVRAANEMNLYHHLDSKLQFDFLINIIRKRKRFSKWTKASTESDIDAVKEYYGYSNELARQALTLLSPDQLTIITNKVNKGGKRRN
jgi:hypothetical protein